MRKEKDILRKNQQSSSGKTDSKKNSALAIKPNRRAFLMGAGGMAGGVLASQAFSLHSTVKSAGLQNSAGANRIEQAYKLRLLAATEQKNLAYPIHATNGDEDRFANKVGSFTKGLVHNSLGEVNLSAYDMMIKAITSGRPEDFEQIPLGDYKKLANPQAAFCYVMEGPDPHQMQIAPAPAFSSAEQAAEMSELYWQSLARDVPFSKYGSSPIINAAAAELSKLSDFRGPVMDGQVTPASVFRGNTPGDLTGPYISQFLLNHIPYGSITIVQHQRSVVPDIDYMHTFSRWLAVQNGDITGPNHKDVTPRYIRTARDLCEYVHQDFSYQPFLSAGLILINMKTAWDLGNPYRKSDTQTGFVTFGDPHVLDLLAQAPTYALKGAWFHKWVMHRRMRPEEFGGRVHLTRAGKVKYPVHPDLLNSKALDMTFDKNGSYLLTQAYPEGCPLHPAYPSGHAVISGASATILKAFFNEAYVIRNPVIVSEDGLSLEPYKGPDLTVGGELNKLAFNIAMGRNFAGIHWRTDASEGLKFGEAVAINLLKDIKRCSNENFAGFSLTKFDGTTIII